MRRRSMLQICDGYAAQFNVVSNGLPISPSVCAATCWCRQIRFRLYSLSINGRIWKVIVLTRKTIIASKKYCLNGQINKVICNFSRVNCQTRIKLVKVYCTSLLKLNYGIRLILILNLYVRLSARVLDVFGRRFLLLLIVHLSRACVILCLC